MVREKNPIAVCRCCVALTNFYAPLTIAQATKKSAAAKSKKFELTEEQKQEIREAFDLFDTDGSGEH